MFRGENEEVKTIWKCLVVDCYCLSATVLYAYVQIAFYVNWKSCAQDMRVICIWLLIEVFYQYLQVIHFVIESLSVLYCIVKQRR